MEDSSVFAGSPYAGRPAPSSFQYQLMLAAALCGATSNGLGSVIQSRRSRHCAGQVCINTSEWRQAGTPTTGFATWCTVSTAGVST